MDMNCLYDSDCFIVVHVPSKPGDGFEIVDKHTEKSTYLTGVTADFFAHQIMAWQANVPEEADVHAVLERFTFLNSNPLVMH